MSTAVKTKKRPTKQEYQQRFAYMYELLSGEIRSGELPPGALLPSEKQLTIDFQLSRASVRKVISLLVQQNLITRVQGKGSIVGELRSSQELALSCMILASPPSEQLDDMHSTPVRPALRAGFMIGVIEGKLVNSGIKVLLMSPREFAQKNLAEQLQFVDSHKIGGIISIYENDNNSPQILEFSRCAAARGINVLAINNSKSECNGIGMITYDNYSIGKIAAEHLLGNGHRVISCIGIENAAQWEKTRILAFSDICKASCEAVDVTMITMSHDKNKSVDHSFWYRIGYDAASEVLKNPAITGVFCVNDYVAKGFYDALIKRGYNVPEDISIIACDNNYDYLSIGFTTISLECHHAGIMAAEIMIRRLGGEQSVIWPEFHLVKPLLIPRRTVKNLNSASDNS